MIFTPCAFGPYQGGKSDALVEGPVFACLYLWFFLCRKLSRCSEDALTINARTMRASSLLDYARVPLLVLALPCLGAAYPIFGRLARAGKSLLVALAIHPCTSKVSTFRSFILQLQPRGRHFHILIFTTRIASHCTASETWIFIALSFCRYFWGRSVSSGES